MFACSRGDKLIEDQLSIHAQNDRALKCAKINKYTDIIELLKKN